MSVSRGLLLTESRSLLQLRPSKPEDAASKAFSRLQSAPAGDYAWKSRRDWASRLCKGRSDEFGRRLYSDAAKLDARYVAKVSRRALKGVLPTTNYQWGHLRNSLLRIHLELKEGM